MGGRKFTRVSDDGMKFSMLGLFLLNDEFNNIWCNFSVIALDMKLLDHYIGNESFTFEYLGFLEQFWKRHEKQRILEQKRRKMHSDQRNDTKYEHLAIRRIKLLPNMPNKSLYSRGDAAGDKEEACSGCIISEGDLFMTGTQQGLLEPTTANSLFHPNQHYERWTVEPASEELKDIIQHLVLVVTYSHVDSSLRALAGQAEGFVDKLLADFTERF
ncbi:hypothetical protein Tco_0709678 [Tanacetum coccineum]